MKFSVLLPTRGGGRFLKNCVHSVLDQPFADMELIVCDNANVDETPDVLAGFAHDTRINVVRLDQAVPVTESWRTALDRSSGDYVILIGDDDYVLRGYFETLETIVEERGHPDCVTYGAYSFVAKDAVEGVPRSYYAESHFNFGHEFHDGDFLPRETRHEMALDLFRFKQRLPMNMQMTLVSRRALARLPNGLFNSPFPDHYALSALLLRAETWLYSSVRPVVVGVSSKSFGRHFHSGRAAAGLDYLGVDTRFPDRLPGNEVLNAICAWLFELKCDYPEELRGADIRRPDYVLRQIFAWYRQRKSGAISTREALARVSRLRASEWLGLVRTPFNSANWTEARRVLRRDRGEESHPLLRQLTPLAGIADIAEFATWLEAREREPAGLR
jgi:glycosyltransferase involved in cell wall biosynthesis